MIQTLPHDRCDQCHALFPSGTGDVFFIRHEEIVICGTCSREGDDRIAARKAEWNAKTPEQREAEWNAWSARTRAASAKSMEGVGRR